VIRAKEGVSEVIWLSQWDTVQDAKQFLTAYRALLQKKYPGSGDAMSMQLSQSKSVSMEMQGRSVLIAVSLRE
jgi:hypothetical protein